MKVEPNQIQLKIIVYKVAVNIVKNNCKDIKKITCMYLSPEFLRNAKISINEDFSHDHNGMTPECMK
jgi:hypothetical protein